MRKRLLAYGLPAVLMLAAVLSGCGGGGGGNTTQYTLNIATEGQGVVGVDPAGAKYNAGTVVTLTPLPEAHWTFLEWDGTDKADVVNDGGVWKIVMDGDKSLIARFVQISHDLTVEISGGGSGTVNQQLKPKARSVTPYPEAETVMLTACPATGSRFDHWSGDVSVEQTNNLQIELIIDTDKTVTAHFELEEYQININVNPPDQGTVTLDPAGPAYHYGDVVTLTVTADGGWRFENWSGDLTGSDNPATLVVDGDKTVTADLHELLSGESSTCTVGGVSFAMHYVPGAAVFPTGADDSGTGSVDNAYWMAETEVTYELWSAVKTWATDAARGANRYFFRLVGTMGDGSGDTNQHPVTLVSWRDTIVWCNALTEYYNTQNGTSLGCVYKSGSVPIRDAGDGATCDAVVPDADAKGFRLPTGMEWELAARYQNGTSWTPGDHVSGDTTSYCHPQDAGTSTVFGDYAWYTVNSKVPDPSTRSAQPVGGKIANALGLCDMSGNVCEWCFDPYFGLRVYRGGSWAYSADGLQVGAWTCDGSDCCNNSLGFRFARNE